MTKTLSALAALAIAGATVFPTVSQAAETESVVVSYADLNLASSAGQQILHRRVASAASTLCGFDGAMDYALNQAVNNCRTTTVAGVQPAVASAINSARRGSVTVLDAAALIVTAK